MPNFFFCIFSFSYATNRIFGRVFTFSRRVVLNSIMNEHRIALLQPKNRADGEKGTKEMKL